MNIDTSLIATIIDVTVPSPIPKNKRMTGGTRTIRIRSGISPGRRTSVLMTCLASCTLLPLERHMASAALALHSGMRMQATDSRSLQRRSKYFANGPSTSKLSRDGPIGGSAYITGDDGKQQRRHVWNWRDALSLSDAADSSIMNSVSAVLSERNSMRVALAGTSSLSSSSLESGFSENLQQQRMSFSSAPSASTSSSGGGGGGNLPKIRLSLEEKELFDLLIKVTSTCPVPTTLRVAGGWVRDKLLSTPEFQSSTGGTRLTSKHSQSKGRMGSSIIGDSKTKTTTLAERGTQPVDIDIALNDMLGREFADLLNVYLTDHGRDRISVGMVMKNPEKSKHLETATMKVGKFWIDFVNLRAEEYAGDSRIPDLMRIGSAEEDAYRRDLTINSLFYNINDDTIEDLTGEGLPDLKLGIISTPLPPLTTLLDDPLRVLRSIRFAARLRFTMDKKLSQAARDVRVREALSKKVSRERIGGEVDLMLRSPDPVGAMRLLLNLNLMGTVFPIPETESLTKYTQTAVFSTGLALLSSTHDYLCECKMNPPIWCQSKLTQQHSTHGVNEVILMEDEETRRLLWYAAFLKPLWDAYNRNNNEHESSQKTKKPRGHGKKAHRSIIMKLMIDDLKRPGRDAEAVEKILKASDRFSDLIRDGGDLSAMNVLLNDIQVKYRKDADPSSNKSTIQCSMISKDHSGLPAPIDAENVQDQLWLEAMEFRLQSSRIMDKVGKLWRASLILSLCEELSVMNMGDEFDVAIEGDVVEQSHSDIREGIIAQHDAFAASMLQLGLVGIWSQKPLIDGVTLKSPNILPSIPNGPVFRVVMDEQAKWMRTHPGGGKDALVRHLQVTFPQFG